MTANGCSGLFQAAETDLFVMHCGVFLLPAVFLEIPCVIDIAGSE
jgi:hypothetical protein